MVLWCITWHNQLRAWTFCSALLVFEKLKTPVQRCLGRTKGDYCGKKQRLHFVDQIWGVQFGLAVGGSGASCRGFYYVLWLIRKQRDIAWCSRKGSIYFQKTESKVGASKGKKEKSYVEVVNTREVPREKRLGEAVWIQLGEEDVAKEGSFWTAAWLGGGKRRGYEF
ncbi:hypothetical protein CK203_109066 [Vitis vinifera]|uniref:Uncharacterized protein n=1 Tax=Vitis vinifera TaxID=29760 RepID=A0A438CYV0_VITVI|nr:hypothetical protein CK203_109066 [Vitis vinifera]